MQCGNTMTIRSGNNTQAFRNLRINMPALDGRNGAPFPCMVSGERWTYAWPSRPPVRATEASGDLLFDNKQYVISDHFDLPPNCKGQLIQDHLALLRCTWFGVQIYLKGGVRLMQEVPSPDGCLVGIEYHLTQTPKNTIAYIRDPLTPSDSPSGVLVVASCAHRLYPTAALWAMISTKNLKTPEPEM